MARVTRRRALQASGVGAAGAVGVQQVGARGLLDGGVQAPVSPLDRTLVGTWAASHHGPVPETLGASGFEDQTLRQVVHTSVGGSSLRLRVSNAFGEQPLIVGEAAMAIRDDGARILSDTATPVRFSGTTQVRVPQGARLYSDPIDLEVDRDQDVVVDLHLPFETGGASWHNFGKDEAFLSPGNAVGNAGGAFSGGPGEAYFFIDGVDVLAPDLEGTIVCFGDSITDGARSTEEANNTYPDVLSRRIDDGGTVSKSVVNAGMNGNRLLHNAPPEMAFGPAAISRLDRDVLTQTGVTDVIVLLGVNDILHAEYGFYPNEPITDRSLIDGLEQLIARCHSAGVRIFGGTITPFAGAMDDDEVQAKRTSVNEWIRTGGAFDGVIDFASALAASDDPATLASEYDSGDGLHPNDAGYRRMAQAVPLGELAAPEAQPPTTTTTPRRTTTTTTPPPTTEPEPRRPTTGFTLEFGPIDFTVSW